MDNFPENAANWTGRKVGEVEDIPQDVEYGVGRFDNRVDQGDPESSHGSECTWANENLGRFQQRGHRC